MIFKVLAKMKIFQIWAKIDDFFKFLAKMMIFQNLVKIDGFSNFNFLCHLKFSNSSQCGMLWCGVVQTTLLWCGVELIPHHTFRQSNHNIPILIPLFAINCVIKLIGTYLNRNIQRIKAKLLVSIHHYQLEGILFSTIVHQ